jgi:membrane protease subunit HflK
VSPKTPDQNGPEFDPERPDSPDEEIGRGDGADAGRDRPGRRPASAEFAVSAQVGTAAALREAMDPANQSLADALRLSYRVLQIVIVILLLLFLVSGVQTIQKSQSGVMLRFGRIMPTGPAGAEALEPGLAFSVWPYPAGEFVLLEVQNRTVDLGNAFWPNIAPGVRIETAIEQAIAGTALRPPRDGRPGDGYVVIRGGDIAHIRLSARYEIERPEQFLKKVDPARGDQLVEWSLRTAVVHVAASLALQDLVEITAETRERIARRAQELLDAVDAGVRINEINIPDARPALAIAKAQVELQNARVEAQQQVEEARQKASNQLIAAAGTKFDVLVQAIQRFEDALDAGDDSRVDEALRQINALLDGPDAAGEVASVIQRASSYQAEIESTLGSEYRLFAGLLESYRRNPRLVVVTRWMDTYARILGNRDVEVYYVPEWIGALRLSIPGSGEIARLRQDMKLERMERRTVESARELESFIPRLGEIAGPGEAGSRLKVEDGRIISPRSN